MKEQCKKFRDLFEPYLDGGLSKNLLSGFEDHLKNCPDCRKDLAQEKEFDTALRSFPRQSCPAQVTDQIYQKTVHQHTGSGLLHRFKTVRPVFKLSYALIGAASIAAVLLLVFNPVRKNQDIKVHNYSQSELKIAREQAKWSLLYVAQNLKKGEKRAVDDVIMDKVPSTIKKAIKKAIPILNGGSS